MKKVLIISYYWPPCGGAGVQRWLKLSKYLCSTDLQVHILTVEEKYASYMQLDNTLQKDIHKDLIIHKTKSFEIIKHYAKLVGKKNVPTAGFSNVDNQSLRQRFVNSLRSNFFIPDPRKGWKKYAVRKALEIIKSEKIETIITTSPPHSTQLIGLAIKKKINIQWIADFRDPWTDIYYYNILGHSWISKNIDKSIEKKVLINADQVITVSKGFKSLFLSKSSAIDPTKFHVIPNGYDPADFELKPKIRNSSEFIICYTGTMSDQYDPFIFFDALRQVISLHNDLKFTFQLVGSISENIKSYIKKRNIPFQKIDTVPHSEVNQFQLEADLLLLVIPKIEKSEGIIPGKIFEYLATKNQTIAIGNKNSDVAEILTACGAGQTFDRSSIDPIVNYIHQVIHSHKELQNLTINENNISLYSRIHQAEQVKALL